MMPRMVDLPQLAAALSVTEAQVEQMVRDREIPGPRSGKWNWQDVDLAMSRIANTESVYFLEMGDFIKIGRAVGVYARVRSLDKSLPLPTTLLHFMPGTCDLETDLHRKFKHLRSKGEWFRKAPELTDFIKELVENGPKTHAQ